MNSSRITRERKWDVGPANHFSWNPEENLLLRNLHLPFDNFTIYCCKCLSTFFKVNLVWNHCRNLGIISVANYAEKKWRMSNFFYVLIEIISFMNLVEFLELLKWIELERFVELNRNFPSFPTRSWSKSFLYATFLIILYVDQNAKLLSMENMN